MSRRRTRAPRNGVISTIPRASRPRSASRTGAWLVPSSLATAVSTMRESGGYEPSRMASSSRSLTWSASTLRVRASAPGPWGSAMVISRLFGGLIQGERGARRLTRLSDLDDTGGAVHADLVTGADPPRGLRGSHDGGDAELPREDGGVRRRPAGVGHQAG